MRKHSVTLFFLCAAAIACRRGDSSKAPAGEGNSPRREIDGHAHGQQADPRALEYAEFTEELVDPAADPVTLFDPERSASGYNLFGNRGLCSAQLVNARGRIVRSWQDPRGRTWSNVELTPEGDLLVIGSGPRRGAPTLSQPYLLRYAWDGTLLWKRLIDAQHDVQLTADGGLLLLASRFRRIPPVSKELDVREDVIVLLTEDGEVAEEHSLLELLLSAPDLFAFAPIPPITFEDRTYIDLLHASSLERIDNPLLAERDPIYSTDNVLVSLRNQDAVAIFDLQRKLLVWARGPNEISGPHDATLLETGNILLFDSGLLRGWSRVLEVNPLTNALVWEYRTKNPTEFFSPSRGSAQRLSNGNTLIANSDGGEAFEVTPSGEIVWRFLNFNADQNGHRAAITRMKRYPVSWIEPLLDQATRNPPQR